MKIKSLLVLSMVCLVWGCTGNHLPWSVDNQKRFARQLREKGFHRQAVRAFDELAAHGGLKGEHLAGIYYTAATICFEDIRDYEQALEYYLKVEISGAKGRVLDKSRMRIVACLERLGKSFDAQKELDRRTLPEKDLPVAGETVIAVIGDRKMTMNEIDKGIRMLPVYLQKEYAGGKKKLVFLKQYIATELMHDSALRRGLDRDPDIVRSAEQMKKNLMVEALVAEELAAKVMVTDTEIRLYHQANAGDFNGRPLDDVRNKVINRLTAEKRQAAYRELMNRLLEAENVVIYEEYFIQRDAEENK